MKKLLLISFAFLIQSCGTTELSSSGKKVKLVKSVGKSCKEVGDVVGTGNTGVASRNMISARNDIRNTAAEKGATHVVSHGGTNTNGRVDLTGTAYRCK